MTFHCGRMFGSNSFRLPFLSHYCPMFVCQRIDASHIHHKTRYEGERGSKISSKMIEVVGNGAEGCGRSVLLRIGESRILFNVSESSDNSLKGLVNGVFVTHLDWNNIGGLVGLIYKAKTSHREQLLLCGPPGLDRFMTAAERFLVIRNFKIKMLDCDSISQSMQSNFHISCIAIRNKHQEDFHPSPLNMSWIKKFWKYPKLPSFLINHQPSKRVELNTSYSYICRSEKNKSWILSECARQGIKPGEDMKKLWMGYDVVQENGTVVKPEDVIHIDTCANIIVIDCPSCGYLDDLLEKEDYAEFYEDEGLLVVHFTPSVVMHDNRYLAWMKRFSQNAKHLIVNDSNEWDGIKKLSNRQQVCRLISTRFFPKLRSINHSPQQNVTPQLLDSSAIEVEYNNDPAFKEEVTSEKWLQKWSSELRVMQLLQSWNGTLINLKDLAVLRANHPFTISHTPEEDSTYFKEPSTLSPDNPRITFLGTGAQGSSQHRNTSAIFVQISHDNAFLMDCGDGVINRFTTLYEGDELQSVLTSIKLIYISHTHADHHTGLFGILRAIKDAWASSGTKPKKVILVFPPPLLEWFEAYHNNFETLFDNVILLDLNNLIGSSVEDRSQISILLNRMLGFKKLRVCWAVHSLYSYCVSIRHTAGWKISYSGDSKYCQKFIEIGRHSDLLIHEATFSSGLDKQASLYKHSTTDEAIRVGEEMRAKHVILTHFSRRYPVVPCLSDLCKTKNVSVAFDFLQVTLKDLHILPKLNAAYEVVFDEYLRAAEALRTRLKERRLSEDEENGEPEEPEEPKSILNKERKL